MPENARRRWSAESPHLSLVGSRRLDSLQNSLDLPFRRLETLLMGFDLLLTSGLAGQSFSRTAVRGIGQRIWQPRSSTCFGVVGPTRARSDGPSASHLAVHLLRHILAPHPLARRGGWHAPPSEAPRRRRARVGTPRGQPDSGAAGCRRPSQRRPLGAAVPGGHRAAAAGWESSRHRPFQTAETSGTGPSPIRPGAGRLRTPGTVIGIDRSETGNPGTRPVLGTAWWRNGWGASFACSQGNGIQRRSRNPTRPGRGFFDMLARGDSAA